MRALRASAIFTMIKKLKHHLGHLCLFTVLLSAEASIQRIEPSCWWVGMKEPVFQILLKGNAIASLDIEIDSPAVELRRIERVDSANYLFLYLEVSAEAEPGDINIKLKDGSAVVEELHYPLLDRVPGSAERQGFNNSDVIYLITPDRFANGSLENDTFTSMNETSIDRLEPYARHGGDLQGIIDHLDYLADLGITALWLNPIQENNQHASSYHGYSITDFYKIDPRFGTNETYRQLVDAAAKRGIKVIMDQVFNQCGSEHWWMQDLPSKDWINFSDSPKFTNHRRTTQQDPYATIEDRELQTRGWFTDKMPDMNLQHPLFQDYMIQNSIWWVEYAGLSGIRQDTYCYNNKQVLSRWCSRVLQEYPNLNITGEEWSYNPIVVSYWQKGKINSDGYEGNLPSLIDFPVCGAIRMAFGNPQIDPESLLHLYEMLANDAIYPNPSNNMIFFSNHDMPRFFMEAGQDADWYKNAMVFLATTRGIPQLYQGDEILQTHHEGDDHGNIRRDFPGGWAGDEINGFSGLGLTDEALDAQNFTRKLLNWRKTCRVVSYGKLEHFDPLDDVYVYFRSDDTTMVMCILNKNEQPYTLKLDRFQRLLSGKHHVWDVMAETESPLGTTLQLDPKQPYILEIR